MTTSKPVTKLGDKLTKVNETFSINMYDNGFMVEVGGRNKKGDYTTTKTLCSTIEEVQALVTEVCSMERDI